MGQYIQIKEEYYEEINKSIFYFLLVSLSKSINSLNVTIASLAPKILL